MNNHDGLVQCERFTGTRAYARAVSSDPQDLLEHWFEGAVLSLRGSGVGGNEVLDEDVELGVHPLNCGVEAWCGVVGAWVAAGRGDCRRGSGSRRCGGSRGVSYTRGTCQEGILALEQVRLTEIDAIGVGDKVRTGIRGNRDVWETPEYSRYFRRPSAVKACDSRRQCVAQRSGRPARQSHAHIDIGEDIGFRLENVSSCGVGEYFAVFFLHGPR